jgi:hypothetical protein
MVKIKQVIKVALFGIFLGMMTYGCNNKPGTPEVSFNPELWTSTCTQTSQPITTPDVIETTTSAIPTFTPMPSTATPTPTKPASPPPTYDLGPVSTPVPPGTQAYILFWRNNDTWIATSDGSDICMVAEGFIPYGWSPSGSLVLRNQDGGIYVAESDGSNPRWLHQVDPHSSVFLWWLNDEWILADIRPAILEAYVTYINSSTGEVRNDDPDYFRIIEDVSPTGEYWFQRTLAGLEIADLSGNRTLVEIPGPGGEPQPMFHHNLVFTPRGDAIIYLGCPDPNNYDACYLFRSLIQGSAVIRSEILLPHDGIMSSAFQVSPDGRYVAIIYNYYPQPIIKILNLQTLIIDYEWNYPGSFAQPFFLWSPDSTLVAVSYNNPPEDKSGGIVVLNISTGESTIIADGSTFNFMMDWRYVVIGE